MSVQVLYIDACPNWGETTTRVRQALDSLGLLDMPVEPILIQTADDAARTGFAGSPTIAVNGEDIFPSDGRTIDLACRVYFTEQGLAGDPTSQQLKEALRERFETPTRR